MDAAAARTINVALGNDENTAVMEMHFPAPEIEFTDDTVFALGGADFDATFDGRAVGNWQTNFAPKGSLLKFSQKNSGNRACLAVSGGFTVEPWLGSRSTNLAAGVGGPAGRALAAGDVLKCAPSSDLNKIAIGRSLIPRYSRFPTLRVVPGGEFDLLTALSERIFLNEMFTLTADSNRMGFRLRGEPLHILHAKELVSAAVTFGTIQLLPDDQMVILMADHQTSGGYPRIANIVSADLPIAGQLGPNDRVGFKLITVREAEVARRGFERDLAFFKTGRQLQKPAR